MENSEKYEEWNHYTLSLIGGFLGMYAIMARCDFFGSAQTANLIYLAGDLIGRNFFDFVIRLGALALYVGAIGLTVWLSSRSSVNLKAVSILIDAFVILLLGFFPADMNPIIGLYPVFFAMAFQWCSFKGIRGYTSATIFSTNNVRQFTTATVQYCMSKERQHLDKLKFFGFTLLSFHIGVAASALLWNALGIHSVWLGLVPAAGALLITALENGWITLPVSAGSAARQPELQLLPVKVRGGLYRVGQVHNPGKNDE